jgi:alpha-methylacyl-CoA racemase
MAGLGPVPHAGLMLAELGALVLRIEPPDGTRDFLHLPPRCDLDRHGRSVLRVDLKSAAGRDALLAICETADCLIEGYRPGVMERLGLGPADLEARNPRLVYGRMTGFGQDGPRAPRAGHDLTYLAISGVLHAIGHEGGRPVPPLNLVADYGGGTMFLLAGLLAALVERGRSGRGQIVDAAMIDGASMLAAPFFAFAAAGWWQERRGTNLLDSGAPFYDTYECSDGRHLAVGCLEPRFFAEFVHLLDLDPSLVTRQYDRAAWPGMRDAIARRIATRPRDDWTPIFDATDACVAPVLTFAEAAGHPHNRARAGHADVDGFVRPAPAPRFSRSTTAIARPQPPGQDTATVLKSFGLAPELASRLAESGAVAPGGFPEGEPE